MKRADLLSLNFYKKEHFSGSENGIRYRVEKYVEPAPEEVEDSDYKPKDQLRCFVWPEPLSFEATADEKKTSRLFEFSEEGLENIALWINSECETRHGI